MQQPAEPLLDAVEAKNADDEGIGSTPDPIRQLKDLMDCEGRLAAIQACAIRLDFRPSSHGLTQALSCKPFSL